VTNASVRLGMERIKECASDQISGPDCYDIQKLASLEQVRTYS
jgi:hypothetical protein